MPRPQRYMEPLKYSVATHLTKTQMDALVAKANKTMRPDGVTPMFIGEYIREIIRKGLGLPFEGSR